MTSSIAYLALIFFVIITGSTLLLYFEVLITKIGLLSQNPRSIPPLIINEAYLLNARDIISRNPSLFIQDKGCHNCPYFTYDWTRYFEEVPVLVLIVEYRFSQFGNTMGFLLTNIACANRSGAHVIILSQTKRNTTFWKALPKVIINPNPASNISQVYKNINHICNPGATFPWDDGSRWHKPRELIWSFRPILRHAISMQMASYGYFHVYNSTMTIPDHLSNGEHGGFTDEPDLRIKLWEQRHNLPRYPDVLIHYRCSDNVFFDNMGLTPFHVILYHIPLDAKYIFITTEKLGGTDAALCQPIQQALVQDIMDRFPHAEVVLRRGGNIFIINDMMLNSKVVICSASSFCFYAATSNTIGQVYLPTRLFYNRYIDVDNVHTMVNASSIYEWIIDGVPYNESKLTADLAIQVLRNQSYRQQYTFKPMIHEAEDVYKVKYGDNTIVKQHHRLRRRIDTINVIDEKYLLDLRERIINTAPLFNKTINTKALCRHCLPFRYGWKEYIGTQPILVHITEYRVGQFGNTIGFFLTALGCANRSGAHVIVINHGEYDMPMWHAMPDVIVHPHPAADFNTIRANYESICNPRSMFPWDDDKSWDHPDSFIPTFRPIMKKAIRAQMLSYGYFDKLNSTLLLPIGRNMMAADSFVDTPNLYDILTSDELESIPPYPDVLIHYRCSDNIFFGNMGLLPFFSIISHIPPRSKYIFIATEPSERPHADICIPIEDELANEVTTHHPQAHVVVRRGGDILQLYSMLMHSRVVICSASSFCFYAATSNTEGRVYLPTRPFYNAYINYDNIHTMKNSSSVFEWHYNGIDYNETTLTVDVALKVLHDPSYHHYHPRVPVDYPSVTHP